MHCCDFVAKQYCSSFCCLLFTQCPTTKSWCPPHAQHPGYGPANGCILTELSLSVTFPSLYPFRFFPLPNPQVVVSSLCEFYNSSHSHTGIVKQFVKLFAIQYGLTFCLYMRSRPTLSFQFQNKYQATQLDLMS